MSKYVVVVKRAIPVEGCLTDTVTGIFDEGSTIKDVMGWVESQSRGSVVIISVEITTPNVC